MRFRHLRLWPCPLYGRGGGRGWEEGHQRGQTEEKGKPPDTEIMNEPPRRLCESAGKTKAWTWIMISSSSGLTIFTFKKGVFLFIVITDCTRGFWKQRCLSCLLSFNLQLFSLQSWILKRPYKQEYYTKWRESCSPCEFYEIGSEFHYILQWKDFASLGDGYIPWYFTRSTNILKYCDFFSEYHGIKTTGTIHASHIENRWNI